MPASSAHQAKRPYAGIHSQSSITSYFPSTNSPTSSSLRLNESPVASPPLPENIQSNLLSVGMRVRKSVPEGYKTGNYSAFTLFSESATHLMPSTAGHQISYARSQSRNTYARKELTPFCGILKVGGLSQQPAGRDYEEFDEIPEDDEYDVPFLSSQGSTISDVSVASEMASAHKRRIDEDDGDEIDAVDIQHYENIWRDEQVSPRSRPVDLGMGLDISSRSMAVPKSRRKPYGSRMVGGIGKLMDVGMGGQENVMSMDFEEADFLDYRAWTEDVGMSDV